MAKKIEAYTPLSETAYYILLSLNEPRHGYGIIKYVEELTNQRIILGSGTVYTTLGKMSKNNFIEVFQDRVLTFSFYFPIPSTKIPQRNGQNHREGP